MSAAGPAAGQAFRLVAGLRFRLFARRLAGGGLLGAALGGALAAGLAGALGLGSWWLFGRVAAIAANPIWQAFSLALFCFLVGLFWVIWPVVAAQVNEAYEMGRFLRFPVRPRALYGIQTVVALVEPAVLFFYPLLLGALWGLADTLRPGWPAGLGLVACFVLMCVATGRCLLNLFLNVMTSRRSGEILFAALLVLLGLAALLPPVDASWLFARLGGLGDSPEGLELLARTARALGDTPPGLLARGLAAAAGGHTAAALGAGAMMLAWAATAWLLGLWLLKRFYRGGRGFRLLPARRRAAGPGPAGSRGWRLPGVSGPTAAVFEKELRTLASNPKGRLLFAVPFFLLIILKVVGAAQLFAYLWGPAWAAVLWTLLGLYVLGVLGGQLFVNGFGYDGHAVRWTFWQPAPLAAWLKGRNLAQAAFAGLQMLGLGAVLFALLPGAAAAARLLLLPLASFAFGLLMLLALGNLLSIRYPRRCHFSLARRDRPAPAAFAGLLAGLGLCALVCLAALGLAGIGRWLGLAALPALGALVYARLLPVAVGRLARGREALIEAVTK